MLEGGTSIISILVIVRNHFEVFALMDRRFRNPDQGVRVGSGRKSPEFNGTWKQYSRLENFGNFPITSGELPALSYRKWVEVIGKFSRFSNPEYCLHIPSNFSVFLPVPEDGIIDLRIYYFCAYS
jgi:hypothetical protein